MLAPTPGAPCLPARERRQERPITAINNSPALTNQFLAAGFVRTKEDPITHAIIGFQSSDLNAYRFNEANPLGGFYSYRVHQESIQSSTPKMKTQGFYVQDQWQMGTLTFSPGVRFDKYEYLADNGQSLFKTDFAIAPRVGLTWDAKGDGRSKVYAYWGRYIDPIKLDMVRFTGSLTSSVRLEQARLLNQWVTVITRGGSKTVDAVFADTFKLPKTDEFRIGYQAEFGGLYTFEATYTKRRDYDIVEDWDPTLYTDAGNLEAEARGLMGLSSSTAPTAAQQSVINAFRGLVIPFSYFAGGGYTGEQNTARLGTSLNFVLANLPGGERKYRTLDLTVTRREADHWGGFMSFSLVNAKGNTQSSGNADFQGDLARFDPRLGYHNGSLEGSVDWLAKAYAYYHWDMGFMVGMTFNANSGYHYTPGSWTASTRVLQNWPGEDGFFAENLGTAMTPMYYQADLRLQYGRNFGKLRGEIYADVINLTNRQEATDLSEGLNIRAIAPRPNTPYQYQAPRRYNFGIRLKF
ncbi:MAG: TonB-dependent receptor [Holophagaceae bacterium]|nr:TonB-dependent receptor [Holophagaceae bacterium]